MCLEETARLDVAHCSREGDYEEGIACAMEAPGPLTPPAPEVAEEDKDEEEEFDDEPPFDEWDLQHEVRDYAVVVEWSS
jgi:hypothetical protein